MSHKTWDEIEAEIDAYQKTKQYKFDQVIYKIRRFVTAPLRWRYHIKHWYQRSKRGYSDHDAWNGDSFLASNIAGIMIWIVENGHGVAMSYADEDNPWDTPVDIMVERRNKEWKHYANIFKEYSKGGIWVDQKDVDRFGGVLDSDMQDALQWLSQHFQELWD